LKIHNPNNFSVAVTGIQVSFASSPAGCPSQTNAELQQSDVSPSQTVVVSANSDLTLPAQGRSAPLIFFKNTDFNQDACKGRSFGLSYVGTGVKP
jgi:hypothetical protein